MTFVTGWRERAVPLACAAAIALLAVVCNDAAAEQSAAATTPVAPEPGADFAALLQEFTQGHFRRMPSAAVNSGLHAYDGRLPDFSPEGIAERVGWLEGMRKRNAAIDVEHLTARDRLYQAFLGVEIDTQLFNFRVLRVHENNAWYDYLALDPNVYVARDYAPLPERLAAYLRHVQALPAVLEGMQRTLRPMPSGHAEAMRDYLAGLATFVRTVPEQVFAPVGDTGRLAEMRDASSGAGQALDALAQWVDTQPRDERFALGAQGYADLLWSLERIDTPASLLQVLLQRDFERNTRALREACARFAPGTSTVECRTRVAARKPPEGPLQAARRQAALLRERMEQRRLATIPAGLEVIVAESPPQWRSSSPYIAVPGAHEAVTPSIYYLPTPDPDWPMQEQRDFMLSESDLMSVTAHCVWSGHILESARSNRSGNPLAPFAYSYGYAEGWSHYSEEMMLHEALDNDAELAIGQLQNALLNDVRALASIGVHTQGMTIDAAERMFLELAFSDPQSARQEAVRATFDPGYALYALGKLMVVKLRDDWLAQHPGASLGEFHDAFLSYGTSPLRPLRQTMLGAADDGELFKGVDAAR
jgi:uncharacterized protein (DUF885 family)